MPQPRARILAALAAAAGLALTGAGLAATPATAQPVSAAPDPVSVVQLGDSYSSGNGAGGYVEKTCWRSPRNYGQRVATQLGADYRNVACSGGVVADLVQPRTLGSAQSKVATYWVPDLKDPKGDWLRIAQEKRLCGTTQPDMSYTYTPRSWVIVGRKVTATVSCQLVAAPQIDAVDETTDMVFLTAGGNDIGFTDIVTQCMVLRSASGCRARIEAAQAKLPTLKADSVAALSQIDQRAGGQATIYLLAYPFLMDRASYRIPEIAPRYDAGKALHDLQVEGDRVQQEIVDEVNRATGRSNVVFVGGVKESWGGHANGLDPRILGDNRRSWLVPVLNPGNELAEFAHPRPRGWQASAEALSGAIAAGGR